MRVRADYELDRLNDDYKVSKALAALLGVTEGVSRDDWQVGAVINRARTCSDCGQFHPIGQEMGRDKREEEDRCAPVPDKVLNNLLLLPSLLDTRSQVLLVFSFPASLQGASRPSSLACDCVRRMKDTPSRLPTSCSEQELGSLHCPCAEATAGISSQCHLRQLSRSLSNGLFASGVLLLTQELTAALIVNLPLGQG